ncbi:MAG: ribosome silencing factor [Muribaculaceae bacterium]|nr:ribosome silencing factor [Bacteroidales bacterium]MDE6436770.1 ribosome silencing factor [Muribaculaceae bacterium]
MTSTQDIKELIIEGIRDRKGKGITVVDMTDIDTAATGCFIIAEGTSTTQTAAIAESVEELVRKSSGVKPYNVDGENAGDWVIMDYGDVWVHIFLPTVRTRYNLEELWSDAKITNLPDLD